MIFIKKYHLLLFLFTWTLINFLQAANTVLLNDEAYYWVYANFLDWGYYDHPPMIAALIKAGYFLFKSELGVRFFIVILNTLTLLIIYKLLGRKNDGLFYAIAFSIALIQLGGFVAAPDIPLAFFVALFFMAYKNFLDSGSWFRTIFLGIVMAMLLYSKYHGVLIILCTLVSNTALFKNIKAYASVLVAIILFAPHLYWQYNHGFPSVQYHLFERSESYKISYTVEYVLGQLLLAGPFMAWLLLFGAFKYRPKTVFERSLKFSVTGIYLFFLISTLKGPVEANWTVPAMIPLIILSHQYFVDRIKWQKVIFFSVPFSLVLVFFVRFYLISDNKFIMILNTNEFEQNKVWASAINKTSHNLPVVFINSYQKASKYWFYSGIPAFSLNTPWYRRNNYNYWPVEKSFQGESVYVMSAYDTQNFVDSVQTSAGILRGKTVDSFYSFSGINLKTAGELVVNRNKPILITILAEEKQDVQPGTTIPLEMYVYNRDEFKGIYQLLPVTMSTVTKTNVFRTTIPVQLPPGEYSAKLAITSRLPGYPSLNSTIIRLVIK